MIRNLKILGLALVAVFAFNAMVASGAMAQVQGKLTSANGKSFTLNGTEVAGANNAFTGDFGVEVRCPGSTYTGHKTVSTPHQLLPNGATETTITPKYVKCVDEAGDPRTVSMNGCDFVLSDATTAAAGTYAVKAAVVCPAGKQITVTGGSCSIAVGAQSGLTGLHITNEAGDIRLSGKVTLKATVCGFIGTTATQDQDVTVKATDSEGKAVNVSMSD